MSISTQITRITEDRNLIRNKFVNLGIAESAATLDDLATAADGIANRGAPTAEVKEGEQYTIQPGYYSGGSVAGVAGGGNYNLQAKTATPTKQQQAISPDAGYYGLSGVTVEAIPEAYQDVTSVTAGAADVLANKTIVTSTGALVAGTMPNNGAVTKVLDASAENQSYSVPAGYHNGSGTVSIVLENKTATPTESSQDIVPTTGKVLGKVTVEPIPDDYVDVSDADGVAENVLEDVVVYSYEDDAPVKLTGTMPNNGAVTKVLDATTGNQSYSVPLGYHNGSGAVSIVLENKTVTPTTAPQNITPTAGKVLSKVVVESIPAIYGNASTADAIAANILSGKKAVTKIDNAAAVVTGTMPDNGTVTEVLDATTGKQTYVVPAGYHSGTGTVSISLETKTATPSEIQQSITPTDGKVLSAVTVEPIPDDYIDVSDADGTAADVLDDVVVYSYENGQPKKITGTMADNGTVNKTLDATTNNQSFSIAAGKHSGNGVVNIVLESKTATPTKSSQSITPTAGKVLSAVTVGPIPDDYQDVSGVTATAAAVLTGNSFVNASGTLVAGTMVNNGAISGTIDGLSAMSYTVPAGYTSGGTVTLTDDIEEALSAI